MIDKRDILFVGGAWPKLASVQIRCVDIAAYLGCDYKVNVKAISEIDARYRAVVFVKVRLSDEDLVELSRRAQVIWDIIDVNPPQLPPDTIFLASTNVVKKAY